MYLLNTELEINWTLYSDVAYPTLKDFSVLQHSPNSVISIPNAITIGDYIPPTINTLGYVTYRFTPTTTGLWKIALYVSGTIVDTREILVSENDILTEKFVSSDLL